MLIFFLLLAGGTVWAGAGEAEVSRLYHQAESAFEARRDAEAVEWLESARAVERELAVPARRSLEEKAAGILYQWGEQRARESEEQLRAAGRWRKNQLPRFFWTELLRRYPQSGWSDDAALRILEDGFCYEWGEYPDCPAFEIRQYEQFLKEYPFSDRRAYVLSEMARRYEVLSRRYSEPAPWGNLARAELCGAMAQALWEELVETYPGTEAAAAARRNLESLPRAQKPRLPLAPGVFRMIFPEH